MSEEKVLTLRGKKAVWAPGGGTGPIDPKRLPEGYPYKEQSDVVLVEEEPDWNRNVEAVYCYTNGGVAPDPGATCIVTYDGQEYSCSAVVTNAENNIISLQNSNMPVEVAWLGHMNCYQFSIYNAGAKGSQYVKITTVSETIHTMAPEFLPAGVGGGSGPIDPSRLPEGYPYKEVSEERTPIWLGTDSAGVTITNGTHSGGDSEFANYQDGECVIVFDGVEYPTGHGNVTTLKFGDPNFVNYPFYANFVFQGGGYTEYTVTCGEGTHQFELYYVVATETIHPMNEEFIRLTSPNGTKYQLTVADDGTLSAVTV